jgi:UDP-glucose 4-epimerase
MKVLVTGGLGFIGSHTVVELQQKGFEVVIIDDLSNSSLEVLGGITAITGKTPSFEQLDLKEKLQVESFFENHKDIVGVIHFAASKAVGESVDKPLMYYENNLNTLIYMLKSVLQLETSNFIFSSSCTVYGQADQMPITENAPIKPAESPYGNTKQIGEEIIKDTCKVHPNLNTIALRYFNPIGAHPSAKIGELSIFGNDYPTPDGTCIRDYIHVVDLAKAHVIALERLINGKNDDNYETFNVGTGTGSTVLEVIHSFEKVSGKSLPYKFAPRREGDVIQAFADTTKANDELGWKAQSSLDEAMTSAWKWEQHIRNI